jgi:hypothetical protein
MIASDARPANTIAAVIRLAPTRRCEFQMSTFMVGFLDVQGLMM